MFYLCLNQLEYKEPVFVTGIDIYETYNLGGVTAVKVLDKNGDWQALWATQKPEKVTSSIGRIFSPPLKVSTVANWQIIGI